MWVTEFGMVKLDKDWQFQKAACAMQVRESGMAKLTKDLQD